MSNNRLYPLDYPPEISEAADQASFALENAVDWFNIQSRDTAVRQAHTRRIAGQNIIATNNRLNVARSIFMPLSQVGQRSMPLSPLQGTVAHMAGGRSYGSETSESAGFYFSNEIAFREGHQLSELRVYPATIFNRISGYWLGGLGQKPIVAIDKRDYARNSTQRVSAELNEAKQGAAGVGDATVGMIVGGSLFSNFMTESLRSVDSYTYSTESLQPQANVLSEPRWAAHNGTSHTNQGVVYGGSSRGWSPHLPGALLLSIELINLTTRVVSRSSAGLANAHGSHGCFGDKTRGIIAGGSANGTSWFSDIITEYKYAIAASNVLSSKLVEPKTCCDGTGSSVAGYLLGGDTQASATSGWLGTKVIDKFSYSSGDCTRIDSQLPVAMADQGCVSDYAASLY